MSKSTATDLFEAIEVSDPADMIIQQIKDLISCGKLQPGERLPSEPKMVKSFNVSRAIVRRALKRLDAYGIVRVVPHSGTYVAGLGVEALGGLLANVLDLKEKDYDALIEVRLLLESHAVRKAAENISEDGLKELEAIQNDYQKQVERGVPALNEDLVFHIKMSEYADNPILKTLISLLTSEVLKQFGEVREQYGEEVILERTRKGVLEHGAILEGIKERDAQKAIQALENHYQQAREFRARYSS